ncbi:hypothetical protein HC891_00955 [Candidatus Gracilibacteria bacterium]|nr:hypothetical protein [Candidatus Gracilibacteria bacterium]
MKKFRTMIGAGALAVALGVAGLASPAKAQVVQPFASGFQLQNLSSTTANITITFYAEDSATAQGDPFQSTVGANSSVTYAVLDGGEGRPSLPDGFAGSAVISSDQKVAAIVNLVSPDISLSFGGEAYVGVSEGSTNVSLPLLFKDYFGFNTFFNVQNVGSGSATVTVTYNGTVDGTAIAPVTTDPITIPAGAAHRFDQNADADLPTNFIGSATVSSTGSDVAAVGVQVGPTTALVYNGFAGGSTEPVFPLINTNRFDFVTGISIQNTGATDTNVTVSYTPGAEGTACTETKAIPAGESTTFAIDAFRITVAGETCANGAAFLGSAAVTANSANVDLVAAVNQLNQSTNKGGTYAAFSGDAGSQTVVFPLVQDRFFGYFTGLGITNIGDVATSVTCDFSGTDFTQSTESALAPGASITFIQDNQIAAGYNGSAVCTADAAGARIVGIANQVLVTGDKDTFFVYEGPNN